MTTEELDEDQSEEQPVPSEPSDREEYELAHAAERMRDARALSRRR